MRLGNMIFRAVVTSVLASVLTLIAELVFSIVLVSDSLAFSSFVNILLALFSSAAFATILIYLLQVYHGSGESEVWEDYPEKYYGIIRDIPKILKKEVSTLIFILTLGGIYICLHIANANLWQSSVINLIAYIFSPVVAFSKVFGQSAALAPLSYLAAVLMTCALYVIIFALFRWKWRRFM